MTKSIEDQKQIEKFREQLALDRRKEFLSSLRNEDNTDAERTELTNLALDAVARLIDLEKTYIKELIQGETVCPGCVIGSTRELTLLETTYSTFNRYAETDSCDT